jgi:hypothetical protein
MLHWKLKPGDTFDPRGGVVVVKKTTRTRAEISCLKPAETDTVRVCRLFIDAVGRHEPEAESALLGWMMMQVSPEMRGRGVENLAAQLAAPLSGLRIAGEVNRR